MDAVVPECWCTLIGVMQEEVSGPMRSCAALPKLVHEGMIHIVIGVEC